MNLLYVVPRLSRGGFGPQLRHQKLLSQYYDRVIKFQLHFLLSTQPTRYVGVYKHQLPTSLERFQ